MRTEKRKKKLKVNRNTIPSKCEILCSTKITYTKNEEEKWCIIAEHKDTVNN